MRRIFFFSRSVDGHLRACLPVVRRRSSAHGVSGRHRADTTCGRSTSARTTPGQFVQAASRCASASDWPRGFDGALRATTVLFYSGMPKRDGLDETGATAAGWLCVLDISHCYQPSKRPSIDRRKDDCECVFSIPVSSIGKDPQTLKCSLVDSFGRT